LSKITDGGSDFVSSAASLVMTAAAAAAVRCLSAFYPSFCRLKKMGGTAYEVSAEKFRG